MRKMNFQRGQLLVEFAIGATVFFFLVFAIVDFGRALYVYDLVGQSARVATRYASVNTPPSPSDCATVGGSCQQATIDYMVSKTGIDKTKLTTTITYGPTSLCQSTPQPGCYINVQMQYAFKFMALPFPSPTFKSSSQMTLTSQ